MRTRRSVVKGIVFGADRKIEFRDSADPVPGPGEVVLEIEASRMCGSDREPTGAAEGEADTALGLFLM
jgi:(R,R)-butanediol dehydrogenase/meso-butanediol dehydrogenase/diacetyl reductase